MTPALNFIIRNALNGGLVASAVALVLTIWIAGVTQ